MAKACHHLAISLPMGCCAHCSIHNSMPMLRLRYAYAMPLLSSQLLPQLRPALWTELGGAVGLGAAVGAELMGASGGGGK